MKKFAFAVNSANFDTLNFGRAGRPVSNKNLDDNEHARVASASVLFE